MLRKIRTGPDPRKNRKKGKPSLPAPRDDRRPKLKPRKKGTPKPDFLDFDKDGNTSESMKKALKDRKND